MSKLNGNHGFVSLLYSIGDNPLGLWSKHVSANGRVRRVEDDELNGDRVIEIRGPNDSPMSTNISCPANPDDFLSVRLPVLAIVLKNLGAPVEIAFQLIDEEKIRRKYVMSTSDTGKQTAVEPEKARLPLKLDEGWNLLEINLRTICQTTYRTEYRALQRLIICPNCCVRRIYLQDRHYEDNETSVELCQAFFDMYMLKWGIHFVERSCQTSEALKEVITDEKHKIPFPDNPLLDSRPKKLKSLSTEKSSAPKDIRSSPSKGITRKKKNSSYDNVVVSDGEKTKISEPATRKVKKSHENVDEEASSSALIATTPIKVDGNVKSNEREGEIFRKWPYNYVTLQQVDRSVSRHLRSINSANATVKDRKLFSNNLGRGSFSEKKFTDMRQMKPSLAPVAAIPSEVEAEATEATQSLDSKKSKLLTTDEAVGSFLEFRHAINKKMLEKFRDRGLTMREVELSIYNSKHRRNSYGQGKLVEKHRASLDKACNVVPDGNAYERKRQASVTH